MGRHGASGSDSFGIRCAGGNALALAIARERHLLDQLPIPVTFFDTSRRLVWLNRAAALVSNRPAEAMLGLSAGEIEPGITIEGGREFSDAVDRVMRTGEAESWQSTVTLDGTTLTWRVTLSPLRSPEGELLGVSAATLDTTEQFWARRSLAVLSQASARIGSTLDVWHTARELTDLATETFAERVTVDLLAEVWDGEGSGTELSDGPPELDGEAIEFRRVASGSAPGCPPEPTAATGGVHSVARDSLIGRVLQDGQPRGDTSWPPGVPDEDRPPPDGTATPAEADEPHRQRAALLVPMLARGTTLGIVTFARHRRHPVFDKADVHLARDLAARTAVCLDNCLRYSRERKTALALQRSLLPGHATEHQAVDIASCYLQSTSTTGSGGDWFDVVPLSGARVALTVGDVVGSGIRATATMGRMRTAVRTLADVELAPDELLTHLDDIVIKLDQEEAAHAGGVPVAGATCLYAAYDPVTGRCSMASAGHPEPVLIHPDGRVEELPVLPGPPLGGGGLKFEATEFDLPAGSLLAFFTNGLLHASDKGPDTARAELHALLAQPAESLQTVCDRVVAHLVPAQPTEDVALLLARPHRLGSDRLASWDLPSDPAVVAPCRERAAARLREWGLGEDVVFTTELITSELVTNAIRYGADPVVLRLLRDTSSLICEVSDGSSTAPHLRRARTYDEGGRGLLLVASLTQRWGTRYSDNGKTIWTEQPLAQRLAFGSRRPRGAGDRSSRTAQSSRNAPSSRIAQSNRTLPGATQTPTRKKGQEQGRARRSSPPIRENAHRQGATARGRAQDEPPPGGRTATVGRGQPCSSRSAASSASFASTSGSRTDWPLPSTDVSRPLSGTSVAAGGSTSQSGLACLSHHFQAAKALPASTPTIASTFAIRPARARRLCLRASFWIFCAGTWPRSATSAAAPRAAASSATGPAAAIACSILGLEYSAACRAALRVRSAASCAARSIFGGTYVMACVRACSSRGAT